MFSWHSLLSIFLVEMVNFSSLEVLELEGNDFTGSIPPYIGVLSSLKAISLRDNGLNGTLNTPGKNLLWIQAFTILIRSVRTIERELLITWYRTHYVQLGSVTFDHPLLLNGEIILFPFWPHPLFFFFDRSTLPYVNS